MPCDFPVVRPSRGQRGANALPPFSMAHDIDYGVIGIVIGHFLLALGIIWAIRSWRRKSVARQYGLHPDAVQFECGVASWLCGCFAFWPVVCCPLDGALLISQAGTKPLTNPFLHHQCARRRCPRLAIGLSPPMGGRRGWWGRRPS